MTPAKLLAVAQTFRSLGLHLYAGFAGVDPSSPEAQAIMELSKDEQETLELWAPDAAVYFGPYLGGDDPRVGAWVFAGIYLAGIWGSCGKLKATKVAKENPPPAQVPIGAVPKLSPVKPRTGFPTSTRMRAG